MTSKKNTLTLDLKDRHDDFRALIHATGDQLAGTHWAVAEVVVRMDGDAEDTPELVNFAHELVNRYNQHDELLAALEEIMSCVAGCQTDDKYQKARAAIARAKGGAE